MLKNGGKVVINKISIQNILVKLIIIPTDHKLKPETQSYFFLA